MALNLGGGHPMDILGWIRKLVPFTHFPFRNHQRDGTFQQLTAVFGSPNVDTNFTLSLGRIPSVYVQGGSTVAGIVYNGSNQGSDWTPKLIVLRASVAGTYNVWVG